MAFLVKRARGDAILALTTRTKPASPSIKPSHWRRLTWLPREDIQIAVSTGCKPTISDDRPEPMPALTADHTPPR